MVRRPPPWLELSIVLLLACARPPSAAAELRLIPEPRQLTPGSGRLPLRGEVTIAVAGGDARAGPGWLGHSRRSGARRSPGSYGSPGFARAGRFAPLPDLAQPLVSLSLANALVPDAGHD